MQSTESRPAASQPSADRRADESALPARVAIGSHRGRGPVDGGWWPYSYDASMEFPALVAALVAHLGNVERIGYDIDLWHSATPKMVCDGTVVRCEGFYAVFAHLISIISGPDQATILLMIAPETSDGIAHAAMSAAAVAAPGDTVDSILGRANGATNYAESAAGQAIAASAARPAGGIAAKIYNVDAAAPPDRGRRPDQQHTIHGFFTNRGAPS